MTPPTMSTSHPPVRLPDYRPRRSQRRRDRLRAAGAACFVLVLVVGVPVGLILGVGAPDALSLPDKSWVTAQLDATTVLQIFSLVVWLAWLHFVLCLVAEWRTERRGGASPSRVLLGGGSQLLARRLVASLLLLSGAATIAGHAGDRSGPSAPPASVATAPAVAGSAPTSATAAPAPARHDAAARPAAHLAATVPAHVTHAAAGQAKKYYEVEAHQGRHYDTLWGISERYLGNGLRYKEIFALNKDRLQPDGGSLTKPDLIRPGWVLRLPADATGEGLRVVAPLPVHQARPAASPHAGAGTATKVSLAGAAAHVKAPETVAAHSAGTALAGSPVLAPVADQQSSPVGHGGQGDTLPQELLGGSLVAAGLLLGLRRRRGAFAPADPESDAAEGALRLAADVPASEFLDRATRQLSIALTAQDRSLPEVYAALLDDDGLTLCLQAPEAALPPSPWVATEDLATWSVAVLDVPEIPSGDAVGAPFPGLAVFGVVDRRRVLIDLEAAPGIVSIGGDALVARNLAASVAVELATNSWSDDVRVTIVGFGDDLAALAPHRIRHADSVAQAVADLEGRLAALPGRFDQPDAVLRGRRERDSAARWRPEVLVLSAPPTPDEARRLAALVSGQRLPAAVLVVGDVPTARWRFVATAAGRLDTGVLGIELEAAALPADRYRPLMGLLSATPDESTRPALVMAALRRDLEDDGATTPGISALPVSVELSPQMLRLDRRFPVEVRLLGPVTVAAPGVLAPDRVALSTEIVAYLALHRSGVHPSVLRAAIWPRGADDDVVEAALGHVRTWLGRAPDGADRLRLVDGRWALSEEVRVDWAVFRTLVRQSAASLDVEASLTRALSLVSGPFGEGLPAGRYGWLASTGAETAIRAGVVAAAHEASELARSRGDADGALGAARTGLLMLPTCELLWRDCLRAAAVAEDRAQLASVAGQLTAALDRHRLREPSASQTDALLAELLPGYGRVAA